MAPRDPLDRARARVRRAARASRRPGRSPSGNRSSISARVRPDHAPTSISRSPGRRSPARRAARRRSRRSRAPGAGRSSRPRRTASSEAAPRASVPARGPVSLSGGSAQPCQRPIAVPLGLAVPREEDRRHAANVAPRWSSACDGQGVHRHRLDRRDRPRGRRGSCGRGRARRHVGAQPARDRRAARQRRPVRCPASPSGWSRRRSSASAESTASSTTSAGRRSARSPELTDDDWQRSFELNLMSAVRATRAALPLLAGRGGAIVNVSSTAGKRPSGDAARVLGDEGRAAVVLAARRGRATRRTGSAATPSRRARRRARPGSATGGLADQQGDRETVLAKVGVRPTARAARRARRDRGGDRVPLLGPVVVRHRRRVERRRRHGARHHLSHLAWLHARGRRDSCRRLRDPHPRARGAFAVAARGSLVRDARP